MSSYFKIRKEHKDLVKDNISIDVLDKYYKKYKGVDSGVIKPSLELNFLWYAILSLLIYYMYNMMGFIATADITFYDGIGLMLKIFLVVAIPIVVADLVLAKWYKIELYRVEDIRGYYEYNRLVKDDKDKFIFIYSILDKEDDLDDMIFKILEDGGKFNRLKIIREISSQYSVLSDTLEDYKNSKGKSYFRSYKEYNKAMLDIESMFDKIKVELEEKKDYEHEVRMLKLHLEEARLDEELEGYLNNKE